MNDLKLLRRYGMDTNWNSAYYFMGSVMSNANSADLFKAVDCVDLKVLRTEINELIDYLEVVKRFRELDRKFRGALHVNYMDEYFSVDEHKFNSLDEVEKAWENKVFL